MQPQDTHAMREAYVCLQPSSQKWSTLSFITLLGSGIDQIQGRISFKEATVLYHKTLVKQKIICLKPANSSILS